MPFPTDDTTDRLLEQELQQVNQALIDATDAEAIMAKQGKTLMDFDLATETINVGRTKAAMRAADNKISSMQRASLISGQIPVREGEFEERTDVPKNEEQDEYKLARERVMSAQDILTPALFKKHPESKGLYESIINSDIVDRQKYFEDLPDYYLTSDEAAKAMGGGKEGKEKYMQYTKDIGLTSTYLNEQFPTLYEIGGEKETDANQMLKYGLRSASLTRYNTDQPRTLENIRKEQEKVKNYLTTKGYRKK